jgi:hypothetical protein
MMLGRGDAEMSFCSPLKGEEFYTRLRGGQLGAARA